MLARVLVQHLGVRGFVVFHMHVLEAPACAINAP